LEQHINDQKAAVTRIGAATAALPGVKGKEAKAAAVAAVNQMSKDLKGHAKDIAQKLNNIRKNQ
jgi:hypothetical protein